MCALFQGPAMDRTKDTTGGRYSEGAGGGCRGLGERGCGTMQADRDAESRTLALSPPQPIPILRTGSTRRLLRRMVMGARWSRTAACQSSCFPASLLL